jgi:hypothetical protein
LDFAGAHELLDKLRKGRVPGTQVGKQPFAADPPALMDLVVVVQEIVEADVHSQPGRERVSFQISLHFVVAMEEHELEKLDISGARFHGLRLPGLLLQGVELVGFVNTEQCLSLFQRTVV